MKKNTKIIFIFSAFLFGILFFSNNVQAQTNPCLMFLNSHWDAAKGQCVCDTGYDNVYVGPAPSLSCKLKTVTPVVGSGTNLCSAGNTCGKSTDACYKVPGGCDCSGKNSLKIACNMPPIPSAGLSTPLTSSVLPSGSATPGPSPSGSATPGPSPSAGISAPIVFTNPLRYNNVNDFVTNVLGTLRSIIVVLSIVFIVLGGIFYITSAGNEKRMTAAKGAITASMIGLAIGIAAPSFLKEIYAIMGGGPSVSTTALGTAPTLTQIALNFLDFLLAIVGVLTLIMMIVGGIMYLTSAGDDKRIESAKKIVTYSIIGIAVSLASLVIVKQIANLLK